MPRKKILCPICGQPMAATSKNCKSCSVPYERTLEHRQKMSDSLSGKPKPWLQGQKRPKVGKKISKWWTPERREKRRQETLARNPDARYHGLSCKVAARLVKRIGHCERCHHDGSLSRLGVHHKDRDKHNQHIDNLEILCHRCHMKEHAEAKETGWDSYHQKHNLNRD